jgi:hypothetical protein
MLRRAVEVIQTLVGMPLEVFLASVGQNAVGASQIHLAEAETVAAEAFGTTPLELAVEHVESLLLGARGDLLGPRHFS